MAKIPNEPPAEGDIEAAIEAEVRKAIKTLGGGTDILLAVSNYSNAELVDTLRQLGAKSDLLTYVGSRGDTMEDDEVLYALRKWNENTKKPAAPVKGRRAFAYPAETVRGILDFNRPGRSAMRPRHFQPPSFTRAGNVKTAPNALMFTTFLKIARIIYDGCIGFFGFALQTTLTEPVTRS